MRTTLDLDDDVYLAVKEQARREKRAAGAVISDLARQALTTPAPRAAESDDAGRARFGIRPVPRRGAVVSNELIDRLRDEDGG